MDHRLQPLGSKQFERTMVGGWETKKQKPPMSLALPPPGECCIETCGLGDGERPSDPGHPSTRVRHVRENPDKTFMFL